MAKIAHNLHTNFHFLAQSAYYRQSVAWTNIIFYWKCCSWFSTAQQIQFLMYLSLSPSSRRKESILFWFMQKEWIFPSNASVAVIISQKLIFVRASTSLMKVQSVATLSLAPLMMMLSLPQHTFAHLAHDNEEDVWDKFVKREDNLSKQKFFILSVFGGGEDDAGSIKGWGSGRMSARHKQKHDVKFSSSCLLVCMQCNRKIK